MSEIHPRRSGMRAPNDRMVTTITDYIADDRIDGIVPNTGLPVFWNIGRK